MFQNYKDCLFNGEIILKSQQRLKSDHHKVYTEEVNKIALSSDDDKRLQTFNRVTTYPYGTPAVNPIQDGHFRGCSRMRGAKRPPLAKIYHRYPTMMKLGTVIP